MQEHPRLEQGREGCDRPGWGRGTVSPPRQLPQPPRGTLTTYSLQRPTETLQGSSLLLQDSVKAMFYSELSVASERRVDSCSGEGSGAEPSARGGRGALGLRVSAASSCQRQEFAAVLQPWLQGLFVSTQRDRPPSPALLPGLCHKPDGSTATPSVPSSSSQLLLPSKPPAPKSLPQNTFIVDGAWSNLV